MVQQMLAQVEEESTPRVIGTEVAKRLQQREGTLEQPTAQPVPTSTRTRSTDEANRIVNEWRAENSQLDERLRNDGALNRYVKDVLKAGGDPDAVKNRLLGTL